MSSFFSERTAEYAILPSLMAQLRTRFGTATPFFFWKSREGNAMSRQLHSGQRVRILAVFARRPKATGKDNIVRGKLNAQLFTFSRAARSMGIVSVAAFPGVASLFDLGGNFPIHWMALSSEDLGDVEFSLDLDASHGQPFILGNQAPRTMSLSEVVDSLATDAITLEWEDAVAAMGALRTSQVGDSHRHPLFGGNGYMPVYVVAPWDRAFAR